MLGQCVPIVSPMLNVLPPCLGLPKEPPLLRSVVHTGRWQAGGEVEASAEEFKRVARAYDQIKRTGSADDGEIVSYASLGGTARNRLSKRINRTSQNMQAKPPADIQVAVRPLESEIFNRFLARSCARQAAAMAV